MAIVKDTGWKRCGTGTQKNDAERQITFTSPDEHSDGAFSDYATDIRMSTFECASDLDRPERVIDPAVRWRGHVAIKGLGEVFRCYAPTHDDVKRKLDAGMLALGRDLVKAFGGG